MELSLNLLSHLCGRVKISSSSTWLQLRKSHKLFFPPYQGQSFSMNLKQSVKHLPNCCPETKVLSWMQPQTCMKINQRFDNLLKNRAGYGLLFNNSGWHRALIERVRWHLHPRSASTSRALPLAQWPVFFRAPLHLGQAAPAPVRKSKLPSPRRRGQTTSGTGIQLEDLLHMYFIGIFCFPWSANIPPVHHCAKRCKQP